MIVMAAVMVDLVAMMLVEAATVPVVTAMAVVEPLVAAAGLVTESALGEWVVAMMGDDGSGDGGDEMEYR